MIGKPNMKMVAEYIGRALLIFVYCVFAASLIEDIQREFRISSAMMLVQELMVIVLTCVRRASVTISKNPAEWIIAFLGIYVPLFFRASGTDTYLIGTVLSCGGQCVVIAGLWVLSRSFGVVPANRGIRTTGIYSYLRHPLYAGYIAANMGFLINNFTVYNLVLYVVASVVQICRLLLEEKHLSESSEEYRAFMQQTRWRLVPGVW